MADFIFCNADLHVHGLYSGAVSRKMIPRIIGREAAFKGINLVGTGDILNARWIKLVKEQLHEAAGGLFEHENGIKFILQTEVEDNRRIHHVILFPDFSKVEELREKLKSKCKNLDSDGRPKLWLNPEEIAEICLESGCLIGPAHAFTPYFGMFSKFDSYKECYGKYWNKIHFLELGLSADTNMADRISELHNLTFLSNSDAHSPWPNKLGREFNKFKVKEISFIEIEKALKREDGRKSVLNVGFNPLEGKYHKTRCNGCLKFFEPKQAEKFNWKCPDCKKSIKKGVDYLIEELSDLPEGTHPEHRPEYIHTIPLSEIVALAIGIKSAYANKVQEIWKQFIDKFGAEIKILLETDVKELEKINKTVAQYVDFFRKDKINYIPGGAGVYGKLLRPGQKPKIEYFTSKQTSLGDFNRYEAALFPNTCYSN